MNDKELKDYIDDVKQDFNGMVTELKQEMIKLEDSIIDSKDELSKRIGQLREFQLTCPFTKELNKIRGRVFRNNILVYIFMSGLMALAWLQLEDSLEVKPKDVLNKLEVLENKIDTEIEREKEEDEKEAKLIH
ncbi:MAG: hypothetical protein GY928_25975 [Colwellia sp.]|nr:hypothetical protein [Colwellia sp.]